MKTLSKVYEVRLNFALKSDEPDQAYKNRISSARDVWQIVEKYGPTSSKLEARRLFLVAVAAGFELYWRDLIRSVVDRTKVSLKSAPHLGNIHFTLGDIQEIIGHKVSLGELISCSFSFQSADMVNRALSIVLGIDLFAELKRSSFMVTEVPRKNRSKKRGPLLQTEDRKP
jgi:hypothetical protein